jgi:hypothetical protein
VLRDATQVMEFQSVIAVPMLQSGRPIGAVSVGRAVPGPSRINRTHCFRRSPTKRSSRLGM